VSRTWIDVTDLIEFWQRQESVSGVQRVIARTAPILLAHIPESAAIMLDRGRGVFVQLSRAEQQQLLPADEPAHPSEMAAAARHAIARVSSAPAIDARPGDVALFLGAVWIADAVMLAARQLHAQGARCVYLLYDLTPVLQTGHTAAVNHLFDRYLALVLDTARRVPAISKSSRKDFEEYARDRGREAPAGAATGLPAGLLPSSESPNPWSRPYVLFVGTIESRKQHALAFEAWRTLLDRHPDLPDLVCIGRFGWHAEEFLEPYVTSHGLNGRISVLSNSVSDEDIAAFYQHAEFTIYPSSYEGWGLPVSESLAFGKVVIAARNSSLPEAGGDVACYFETDDLDDFVSVIERDGLDRSQRELLESRIREEFRDVTWQQVAGTLMQEIEAARAAEGSELVHPEIELGKEVMLSVPQAAPDAGHADQMFEHLRTQGLTPMLQQPRNPDDFRIADAALIGEFGSPQAWGLELRPGRHCDLRITRPVDGDLVALVATRSMPGVVVLESVGPGGPTRQDVYLGSVVTIPLGSGNAGEPAHARISVIDAQDSIEGFCGLVSFAILRADDLQAQVLAHKSAADALRQELDFIQSTRSWKATAPLRKWKGRGAQ
jgi:glycosyltransferase involved in cell wall biosynthesis